MLVANYEDVFRSYLYGHMQKISMIQAGFHRAVFIAATADVWVWRTHDEELVEVTLGQKLKQHADRLLLGNHTHQAHQVGVLKLGQHCGLLWWSWINNGEFQRNKQTKKGGWQVDFNIYWKSGYLQKMWEFNGETESETVWLWQVIIRRSPKLVSQRLIDHFWNWVDGSTTLKRGHSSVLPHFL